MVVAIAGVSFISVFWKVVRESLTPAGGEQRNKCLRVTPSVACDPLDETPVWKDTSETLVGDYR